MIETALGIVYNELKTIDVPYEFMRWTSSVNDRYWVGEFVETPTNTEDGYEEGTLMLTGTTKSSWATLMRDRAIIKEHFPSVSGLRKSTDDGVVVFFYEHSTPIPTGDADLKRIQIDLRIKMWKGMK